MNTTTSPTELPAVPGSGLGPHTPGPWRWYEPDDETTMAMLVGPLFDPNVRYSERQHEVCDFGDCEQYYPSNGTEPSDADKALIAAAPDLLAACVRFLNPTDEGPTLDTIIRAAVAKALGQNDLAHSQKGRERGPTITQD